MTFTVFITFYFPCVATIAALLRAMERKWVVINCAISVMVAIALALCTRLAFAVDISRLRTGEHNAFRADGYVVASEIW